MIESRNVSRRRCPVVSIDDVCVAARRIHGATVGAEGQPDERCRLLDGLHDGPGPPVHDLHTLHPPSIEQEQNVGRVRRHNRRQRERADVGTRPGRIESDTGRQAGRLFLLREHGGCRVLAAGEGADE